MKKVILFLLVMPVPLLCQVVQNFESGTTAGWSESTPGHWKADTMRAISGVYSFHHIFDNPESGNDQAGIPLTNLQPSMGITRWSFKLRHGYDPSSSNNWGVFLVSDNPPSSMIPGGQVNGYVIGVNLTGYDDTLRLWKVKNGMLTSILNCGVNWQTRIGSSNSATINVERSESGRWKCCLFTQSGGLIDSAACVEPELFDAGWFGVFYKYSSTRDRLLWIDDIAIDGVFYEDKIPPEVIKCTNYTLFSVDLSLNEEPDSAFFSCTNFTLNGTGENAVSIAKLGKLGARISFGTSFKNKSENILFIRSLCDKKSNCSRNKEIIFVPVLPEPGDIVISEIMADPLPPVALPGREYLELLNTSGFRLNLKNWKLIADEQSALFPDLVINPDERIILCQLQDTSLFSKSGRVTGIKPFPILTDGGRLLILSDSLGGLIHGVDYSPAWYGDDLKKDGGWSLEMIDTHSPFFSGGNWSASASRNGGTPGNINSVTRYNPDISFSGLTNAFPEDSCSLKITFSEPVRNLAENINGIRINDTRILTAYPVDPLLREFIIKPSVPFSEHEIYTLSITGPLSDFAGNLPEVRNHTFGIPERPAEGDILFNEILFNPLPGEADFIELTNISKKILDAIDLNIVSVNEAGVYSSPVALSGVHRNLMPGAYYAISSDRPSVVLRYFGGRPENIFELSQLPSMPDDKGHLILFNRQLDRVDEVPYNEKMHFSLLSGFEGISLEKVRPSINSSDPKNWHSASEASGWGTPGAPNSAYSEKGSSENRLTLSSSRITPDNDGYEDFLVVDINPGGSGNVVSVIIYDETGGFVRKIADNLFAGTTASLTWDGTGDDGSLVDSGIYIILISVYDDTGKTEKWKKVCAVVR